MLQVPMSPRRHNCPLLLMFLPLKDQRVIKLSMGWILVSCAMNLNASVAHLSKLQPDNLCATSSNFVRAIVLSEPMLHLLSTRYPPFPLFLVLPSPIHHPFMKIMSFFSDFVIYLFQSVMNLVPSTLPSMQL